MNIYQIDKALLDLVDQETGEILDTEAFDQLQMEREAKLENVACWYKNLVAMGKDIRQEEINLADRRKRLEKQSARLKKYLEDALCGEKFQTARCEISFRKTTSVNITDMMAAVAWAEESGNGDLVSYKAPDISKTELAKILKSGEVIPGAELVDGLSMGVK